MTKNTNCDTVWKGRRGNSSITSSRVSSSIKCLGNFVETGEIVRIRKENGRYTLTYKGLFMPSDMRIKPSLQISLDKECISLFKEEYQQLNCIRKEREIYKLGSLIINLDRVETLGNFIEISAQDVQDEEKIKTLFRDLEISQDRIIKKCYFDLKLSVASAVENLVATSSSVRGCEETTLLNPLNLFIGMDTLKKELISCFTKENSLFVKILSWILDALDKKDNGNEIIENEPSFFSSQQKNKIKREILALMDNKNCEKNFSAELIFLIVDLIKNMTVSIKKKETNELGSNQLSPEFQEKVFVLNSEIEKKEQQWREAIEKIMEQNNSLVKSIAKKFIGALSLGELEQTGLIGLAKAIVRYDNKTGASFSVYANWWIEALIRDVIKKEKSTIWIPKYMQRERAKLKSTEQELIQKLQKDPTIGELALALEWPVEKVKKILNVSLIQTVSLSAPVNGEEAFLGDFIRDPHADDLEELIMEELDIEKNRELLKKALRQLPLIQRLVVCLRNGLPFTREVFNNEEIEGLKLFIEPRFSNRNKFSSGLVDGDKGNFSIDSAGFDKGKKALEEAITITVPLTLQEIGNLLGCSRQRIYQHERKAVELLKKIIKTGKTLINIKTDVPITNAKFNIIEPTKISDAIKTLMEKKAIITPDMIAELSQISVYKVKKYIKNNSSYEMQELIKQYDVHNQILWAIKRLGGILKAEQKPIKVEMLVQELTPLFLIEIEKGIGEIKERIKKYPEAGKEILKHVGYAPILTGITIFNEIELIEQLPGKIETLMGRKEFISRDMIAKSLNLTSPTLKKYIKNNLFDKEKMQDLMTRVSVYNQILRAINMLKRVPEEKKKLNIIIKLEQNTLSYSLEDIQEAISEIQEYVKNFWVKKLMLKYMQKAVDLLTIELRLNNKNELSSVSVDNGKGNSPIKSKRET
ncbi:MAG: class IV adenylate cyclase [Candidatus Omnitrophota bacterium]|nr:class IV adenylate cyclase [Candidatus Omnitrophota bacterium]